jgi:hypothetical protein
MKKTLLTSLLAICAVANLQASNVIASNFATGANAVNSHPAQLSNGNFIANGAGVVAVGLVTLTDAQVMAVNTVPEWVALLAGFSQFGATTTTFGGASAVNNQGMYKLTAGFPVPDAASPFADKNIYTLMGNGATLATSTEVAVFKGNDKFVLDQAASTNAPLTGNPPGGTLLVGTIDAAGSVNGGFNTPAFNTTSMNVMHLVNLVPEPTTALLGVLSLGFGFIRRRR